MQEKPRGGLFGRLSKTRENLTSSLSGLFSRGVKLDESLYEEIEDQLIMADLGVEPAQRICNALRETAKIEKPKSAEALLAALTEQITTILEPVEQAMNVRQHQPFVILMVGVNGSGKTTTIGKLAAQFKNNGAVLSCWLGTGGFLQRTGCRGAADLQRIRARASPD